MVGLLYGEERVSTRSRRVGAVMITRKALLHWSHVSGRMHAFNTITVYSAKPALAPILDESSPALLPPSSALFL